MIRFLIGTPKIGKIAKARKIIHGYYAIWITVEMLRNKTWQSSVNDLTDFIVVKNVTEEDKELINHFIQVKNVYISIYHNKLKRIAMPNIIILTDHNFEWFDFPLSDIRFSRYNVPEKEQII